MHRVAEARPRARFVAQDKDGGTIVQQTGRIQAQNAIVRAIAAFRQDQEYCLPHVYGALTADEREPDRKSAMSVRLYMPSEPPEGDRSLVAPAARQMEAKVRWASMADALDDLRHQLRLKGVLNKFKLANITGQRANTRARGAQDAVNANVQKAAMCYRRHRAAYLALEGPGKWERTMRLLDDTDCRGLGDRLLEQLEQKSEHAVRTFLVEKRGDFSSGESHYELPWIWYNSSEESSIKVTDGKRAESSSFTPIDLSCQMTELMVEWSKCRARAQHWVEEIRLLAEEMRRVVAFNESLAAIWDGRREPVATVNVGDEHKYSSDVGWADGVRSYACKQAFIRRQQAASWRREFADARKAAERFLALHTPEGFSIEPLIFISSEELVKPARRSKDTPRPKYTTPEGYIGFDESGDAAGADEEGWGEETEGDWEEVNDAKGGSEGDSAKKEGQAGAQLSIEDGAGAGRKAVEEPKRHKRSSRKAHPRSQSRRTPATCARRHKKH